MIKTMARDADRAEILRRLRTLRHDSDRRWGRMSAHQTVCHLSDGYRLLTGRPTALSPTPLPRFMMRWIALYLPVPWPHGILTTTDLDQDGGGTRPVEFAADLAELERLLIEVTTDHRDRFTKYFHPIFGQMSKAEWMRWAYLHADHHLRQFGA